MTGAPGWQGDFLSNYDRPIRRNLRDWSIDLTVRLEKAAADPGSDPHLLPPLFNNATLVLSYCGQLELAERTCLRQARWSVRCLSPEHPDYVAMVLQPLINVGRLQALTGQLPAALNHFDESFLIGQLAGYGLPANRAGFPRVAHNACVIESLRVLLASADSRAALRIIRRERAEPGSDLDELLDEATVLASPPSTAADPHLRSAKYRAVVLAVRSIAVTATAHRTTGMRDTAATIAVLLLKGELDWLPAPTLLRLGEYLAALLADLGLSALSIASWRQTLQLANQTGDEVSQAACLAGLSGADGSWDRQLTELATASSYARVRRLAGLNPALPADHLPALATAVGQAMDGV
jgi:hypothetical protein